MEAFLILALILLNSAAFFCMGLDKYRAQKHQWRISERTLLLLGFFGGSLGGFLGMLLFHHKTRHLRFRVLYPLFLVCHCALLILYFLWKRGVFLENI